MEHADPTYIRCLYIIGFPTLLQAFNASLLSGGPCRMQRRFVASMPPTLSLPRGKVSVLCGDNFLRGGLPYTGYCRTRLNLKPFPHRPNQKINKITQSADRTRHRFCSFCLSFSSLKTFHRSRPFGCAPNLIFLEHPSSLSPWAPPRGWTGSTPFWVGSHRG